MLLEREHWGVWQHGGDMVRSMLNDCEGVPPWWVLSLLRLCQEDDASLLIELLMDTLIEFYFGAETRVFPEFFRILSAGFPEFFRLKTNTTKCTLWRRVEKQ